MARKTKTEEIFSKAKFADDPNLYSVTFRDFDTLRTVSLPKFLDESENFQTIPASRIKWFISVTVDLTYPTSISID